MNAIVPRLLLGAAIAAAMVVAVDLALHEDPGGHAVIAALKVAPEPPSLDGSQALPEGSAWLIYLLAHGRDAADGIRPLVAVDADGALHLLRPAPVPDGPRDDDWFAAGISLPTATLAELSPAARAAVLLVIRRWRGGLGLPWRARVIPPSPAETAERDILLRFLR